MCEDAGSLSCQSDCMLAHMMAFPLTGLTSRLGALRLPEKRESTIFESCGPPAKAVSPPSSTSER